jgi:DNA-binding MarR family transcriptional regulator
MQSTVEEIGDAVLVASRALVALAARSLSVAPPDVTLPQYRALVVLATRGPQRPSDLAAELAVAPSSVTRLADRLVGKDLVARDRSASSGREVRLAVTDHGRAIVDAVTAARRREIARVVGAIPEERRAALVASLEEFARACGEAPAHAWALGFPP